MNVGNREDTIIAPLTPSVGGSVSLIRVSGSKATRVVDPFFPKHNLSGDPGGRHYYGPLLNEQGEIIDQVIVLTFRKPKSYTGEDVLEISCHANPLIVRDIVQLLLRNGCRLAEPGEFTKRAFLNGRIDLAQAEAVADLIAARSREGIRNSLAQLRGKLSLVVGQLKRELIELSSYIELDLDFSQEELEIISTSRIEEVLNSITARVERLLESYTNSKPLIQGIEVLISGKPNVGKSSLMNVLLNKDRVIVSEQPGTTRDIVHEDILIDNTLVRFIDTAGIRFTTNAVEAEGVERTRDYYNHADIILLLVDSSLPLDSEDINMIKTGATLYRSKILLIGNKMDLGVNEQAQSKLRDYGLPLQFISAKMGENIDAIKEAVLKKAFQFHHSNPEEVLITNERQKSIFEAALQALLNVKAGLKKGLGYEYLAVDLKDAVESLSKITGEITTDDILNSIFSHFCIGK